MSKVMSKNYVIVLIVSIVVIASLGIGAWYVYSKRSAPSAPPTAFIEITADGFIPQVLQIEPGTRVVWINRDSAPHGVTSGPYPEQDALPSLKSGDIGPSSSYIYTFDSSGSVPYYDPTQPTREGSIEIK